jgi:hypothetical protein
MEKEKIGKKQKDIITCREAESKIRILGRKERRKE